MNTASELNPCPFMAETLEKMAKGELNKNLWAIYAKIHVSNCPQCTKTLRALEDYFANLPVSSTPQSDLPTEFWSGLDECLNAIETNKPGKPQS